MIRGRTFGAERVLLDGAHYIECRFEGSTLVYFGGKVPELDNCVLQNVKFAFDGPARNTLQFVEQLKAVNIGFAFEGAAEPPKLGAQG